MRFEERFKMIGRYTIATYLDTRSKPIFLKGSVSEQVESEILHLIMSIRIKDTKATQENDCKPFSPNRCRIAFQDQPSISDAAIIEFTPQLQTLECILNMNEIQ